MQWSKMEMTAHEWWSVGERLRMIDIYLREWGWTYAQYKEEFGQARSFPTAEAMILGR